MLAKMGHVLCQIELFFCRSIFLSVLTFIYVLFTLTSWALVPFLKEYDIAAEKNLNPCDRISSLPYLVPEYSGGKTFKMTNCPTLSISQVGKLRLRKSSDLAQITWLIKGRYFIWALVLVLGLFLIAPFCFSLKKKKPERKYNTTLD